MSYYFAIPDLHGRIDLFDKAMALINDEYPDYDQIIFLGDYIDRGPKPHHIVKKLMEKNDRYVLLMGNHEKMFIDAYYGLHPYYHRKSYHKLKHNIGLNEVIPWMKGLKLFHIVDQNVFAHAYYDDMIEPDKQEPEKVLWHRMYMSEPYENKNQGLYLTHGHTPVQNGPIQTPNRTNLDAGAVFYDRLVIAKYETGVKGPVQFLEVTGDKYNETN